MAEKIKEISNGVNEYLWETIKEEGRRLGIPPDKNRALIREYLQGKIIFYLYQEKDVQNLSFVGGTSLRILRGLDRFSEDLDFDNLGLNFRQVKDIFRKVKNNLEKEGLSIEYDIKKTDNSGIGELKFLQLLYRLGISGDKKEKLNVKINYTTPKSKPPTEVLILSRFGLVQTVVTNTKEFLFSQKIRAILNRKDLQPRDFYDAVWFFSRNIQLDFSLLSELGIRDKKQLLGKLKNIYKKRVEPNLSNFKARLKPFLINEENIYYLDVFEKVIVSKLS